MPNLHCIDQTVFVGKDSITRLLLTRESFVNLKDIQGGTLYKHAKEIAANCKKALAICKSSHFPYRSYNGVFPSRTDWFDYLDWLRTEMYKIIKW